MKAIAVVTVAFLPLATIAVRRHSYPSTVTKITKKAGSLWHPILQLRFPKEKNSSRK